MRSIFRHIFDGIDRPFEASVPRGALVYILRDTFPNADGPPAATPHTMDVGGTLTLIQTDGQFTISGGSFAFPAQASPTTFADLGFYKTNADARVAGQGYMVEVNYSTRNLSFPLALSGNASIAFDGFTNIRHGFYLSTTGGVIQLIENAGNVTTTHIVLLANTAYTFIIIPQATGALYAISGGTFGTFPNATLVWVGNTDSTANLRVAFSNATGVGALDNLRMYQLDTVFANGGVKTVDQASLATGDNFTGVADAFIDLTWQVATAETFDLMFRRTDDNNTWIMRCDQAAGNVKLFEKNAGVETQRGSTVATTFTNGVSYRLRVWANGQSVFTFVDKVAKASYATGSFNQTATGVKISGFATASNLTVRPIAITISPFDLPRVEAGSFLTIGDSKTMGVEDSWATAYPRGYQIRLSSYVVSRSPNVIRELTPRLGTSGNTVALRAASIDADLATVSGSPSWVLINLGANDVTALPAEATWKANYLYILDAVHAKWGSAPVYLAKPWRRSYNAECDTVAGWIDDIVALRSSFAHVGIDERTVLKGGDNGATNTGDGLHPNAAGMIASAAAWGVILGY